MLFKFITAYLFVKGDKILVIEEPEESMTPLQQVVFAKYLEHVVEKSMNLTKSNVYVILTTHSPYIALAFSNKIPIKFFTYNGKKITIEDKPLKSFVLADLIISSIEKVKK